MIASCTEYPTAWVFGYNTRASLTGDFTAGPPSSNSRRRLDPRGRMGRMSRRRPETPFHDLQHFIAYPRVNGLALSPDGRRLATIVSLSAISLVVNCA